MDPKRTQSELGRFARAPFGESAEREEKLFQKQSAQLKRFAEDLENNSIFRKKMSQKKKKVLGD